MRQLRSLIETRPRGQADTAGRYALLPVREPTLPFSSAREEQLLVLARWGVLFRKLLEREGDGVRWGELVRVLRTLEARGELRGGRFVANYGGEQYALPEAVSALRKLRREPAPGELVSICGSDPLNLVGILTAGARVVSQPSTRISLRDGLPVAVLSAGRLQLLVEATHSEQLLFEAALRSQRAGRPFAHNVTLLS